jgi:hypothetical protein
VREQATRTILIWVFVSLSGGLASTALTPAAALADRIVLRNLDVIDNQTVTGLDEDGVLLGDGTRISWDRIERGRVASEQQARFDQLLAELGGDLYRVRQRLAVGDWAGLLPNAEALEGRYVGRRSETAYMVFQALMWARLAAGQREAALAPFLRVLACQQEATAAGKALELPGERRMTVDPQTGFTSDLSPVWFDAEAARQALPSVATAIGELNTPPPAARMYYATLAITAGTPEKAEQALAGLQEFPALRAIVEVQREIPQGVSEATLKVLMEQLPQIGRELRPVALYWLGRARIAQPAATDRQDGLLNLLELPALYGQQEPELAAAGLYEVCRTLAAMGDTKESIAVRRELLDRYATTWHARKLQAEDEKVK